ncbi:MAG: hypothetical protein ACKO1O_10440 [Erythrobacter sp.]
MIDIGRVFATSWAMFRQRFWLLLGMFAVFFAIQMVGSFVLGIVMALMGAAGAVGIGAGFDDPASFTGMSVVFILVMILFYGSYAVLALVQQAAMVTIASPLEEPSFGAAMARGFKSVLPFIVISLILGVGYLALGAAVFAVAGVAGLSGGTAGGIVGLVLLLLFMPVIIYLACRLSVLIGVVAVDQVFNPIAAIKRSWAVTEGRVLGIFLATLAFMLLSLVILGLPFLLMFGSMLGSGGDPGAAAIGVVLLGFLTFIPLLVLYTMFASAYMAALHSELTGGGAERLEEVFA